MNRPYKNPNRWTINHVPVMREKPRFDYWLYAFCFAEVIAVIVWLAWALRTI